LNTSAVPTWLNDILAKCRCAIFGHVTRSEGDVLANMLLFNQVNSSLSHFQVTSGDADVVDPATDGLTKFVWTADYCPLICGDTLFNMAHGA